MGFGEGLHLRIDHEDAKKRVQSRSGKQRETGLGANCIHQLPDEERVNGRVVAAEVIARALPSYVVGHGNASIPYLRVGHAKAMEHIIPTGVRVGPEGVLTLYVDADRFGPHATVVHYHRQPRRVPVDHWLSEQVNLAGDDLALGEVASQVVRRCADPHQRSLLVRWFQTHAPAWVTGRVPALAAALEAAADLNVAEALDVVAAVLEDDTAHPVVALVAAQRARRFYIADGVTRRRVTASLRRLVTTWSAAPSTIRWAELAAPSIAILGGDEDLAWVAAQTVDQPTRVVWGLVQGVLDRTAKRGADVDEPSRVLLYAALMKRLRTAEAARGEAGRDAEAELRSSIIWCLGGVAPKHELASASETFVSAFARGGPERVAALNGARIAIRRWESAGTEALVPALEALPTELRYRFLALLVTLSPG